MKHIKEIIDLIDSTMDNLKELQTKITEPDLPVPPLQAGNWVIDSLMDKTKTIELIIKKHEDGSYDFINLDGFVRTGYNQGRFHPHTLTEADLPKEMFLQTSGEAGWEVSWTWDDVDYYIQGGKNKVIAKALEHSIGRKLLEKAGI